MIAEIDQGIAIRCDLHGILLEAVLDELGLASRVLPHGRVVDLADPAAHEKFGRFLATVQSHGSAFDWEITVPLSGALQPLHFAGATVGTEMLVLAARSRNGLVRVARGLRQSGDARMVPWHGTLGALAAAAERHLERDDALYDELMRVNNDLATLQREVVQKKVELERLNEEKNRLLGMAAHDLRNPLGVILRYAEFLTDEAGPALSDEHREFLATIAETSKFMMHLVDDLLDVSQIEAGKLHLDLQPVDLGELVRRAVTLNRLLAARKKIALDYCAPPAEKPLLLDARKIEQVLNNLIGNAVKFSAPGTTVRVRCKCDARGAEIAVEDRGQGIREADLSKLFQPFSRTATVPTGGEQSTGLGLAIVRRIVEGHGGQVRVESAVGRGSTFSFTLPVRSDR